MVTMLRSACSHSNTGTSGEVGLSPFSEGKEGYLDVISKSVETEMGYHFEGKDVSSHQVWEHEPQKRYTMTVKLMI